MLRNYDIILNSLYFKTPYSIRHIYVLFLNNVFKDKVNCNSISDAVGIRVYKANKRIF